MNKIKQSTKSTKSAETLLSFKRLGPAPAQAGEVWHRVDGSSLGEEVYMGVELDWTSWQCHKTTAHGAWFQCIDRANLTPRFALTSGARAIHRTKKEALERLIARKVSHLRILSSEAVFAQDTLDLARTVLGQSKEGA
jgi:hypothetical protein